MNKSGEWFRPFRPPKKYGNDVPGPALDRLAPARAITSVAFSPAAHPERMPEISRGLSESASNTPGKRFENPTTPAEVAESLRAIGTQLCDSFRVESSKNIFRGYRPNQNWEPNPRLISGRPSACCRCGQQRSGRACSHSVWIQFTASILIHELHRPLRIRCLRTFHRAPENAVEQIFRALIRFLQRQLRGRVGILAQR